MIVTNLLVEFLPRCKAVGGFNVNHFRFIAGISYQRERIGALRGTPSRSARFLRACAFSSGDIFLTSLISSSKNCCLVTHCGSGFLSFKGTSHTVNYMLNSARNRLLVHHLSILSRTRLCHAISRLLREIEWHSQRTFSTTCQR